MWNAHGKLVVQKTKQGPQKSKALDALMLSTQVDTVIGDMQDFRYI